jgi:hypothetical protein
VRLPPRPLAHLPTRPLAPLPPVLVALGWLLLSATSSAHHYIGNVYDSSKRVALEGVVTAFRFVPAHPILEIDVVRNGKSERWRLEMDNHFELRAIGMDADTLKAGDKVTAEGSAAKDGSKAIYVRSLERPVDGFLYEQVGSSPRVRMRR